MCQQLCEGKRGKFKKDFSFLKEVGTSFLSPYDFKFAPLEQAKSFDLVDITLIGNECEDVTKMFVGKVSPPLRHNKVD